MSADYDNRIGTIPPGFLAPADGNYAPNAPQNVAQSDNAAAAAFREMVFGEQVAQILAARCLDNEARTQVVRLITERAQQLVPGATKRALSDWTQTTLAAHRGKIAHSDTQSPRREVAPAAPLPRASHEHTAPRNAAARAAGTDGHKPSKGRVNYRKLSDEQILEL